MPGTVSAQGIGSRGPGPHSALQGMRGDSAPGPGSARAPGKPANLGRKSQLDTIPCQRCKQDGAPLAKPPFKNPLGERIHAAICQTCWAEWLEHQTLLINHYGLDPRDPKAKEFLFSQIESVLLGEGGAEQIDQSKEGSVEW